MTPEAKEARRAYKRQWNREHRDRVKQYQKDYWERKAAATPAKEEAAADPVQ